MPFGSGALADCECSGSIGKGVIVKTSVFTSILLSTLFYTTLLSTTFVLPLVFARDDAGMATMARDAQVWDRSLDTREMVQLHRDLRFPQTDATVSGPAARLAPIDKTGPDAAIIKPGRARTKTIKM